MNLTLKFVGRLAAALFAPLNSVLAADFAEQREQVLALGQLTTPPALQPAADYADEAGLKAIFYEALP